ncbi:MAG: hypothetical protein NTW50_00545 [Candidatus Berkelbacteria bacterium]|nr:hypothetical protein [Candidatus Berkelbacteria bacterium]
MKALHLLAILAATLIAMTFAGCGGGANSAQPLNPADYALSVEVQKADFSVPPVVYSTVDEKTYGVTYGDEITVSALWSPKAPAGVSLVIGHMIDDGKGKTRGGGPVEVCSTTIFTMKMGESCHHFIFTATFPNGVKKIAKVTVAGNAVMTRVETNPNPNAAASSTSTGWIAAPRNNVGAFVVPATGAMRFVCGDYDPSLCHYYYNGGGVSAENAVWSQPFACSVQLKKDSNGAVLSIFSVVVQ